MYFPNSEQSSVHHLNESFFAGMRSAIDIKTLKKLAEFAKTIPEPELFGIYQDESHYTRTLDLMEQSTDEVEKTECFIKKIIFPLLKSFDKFLDIGPGDGRLTNWIGNNFNYVTALDVNKEIIDRLKLSKLIPLEKIHSSIVNASLRENCYSLTLLSHVLYYVASSKWLDVVKLAYRATSDEGVVVIVLGGEQGGKADLIKKFGGSAIKIDALVDQCKASFGSDAITVFTSKSLFGSVGLWPMLLIAGFFLYDVGISVKKNDLSVYIENSFKKEKNLYEMNSRQKFIVIKKNGK